MHFSAILSICIPPIPYSISCLWTWEFYMLYSFEISWTLEDSNNKSHLEIRLCMQEQVVYIIQKVEQVIYHSFYPPLEAQAASWLRNCQNGLKIIWRWLWLEKTFRPSDMHEELVLGILSENWTFYIFLPLLSIGRT